MPLFSTRLKKKAETEGAFPGVKQPPSAGLRKLPGGELGKSGIQLGKEGRVAGSEAMLDEQVSVHFAWESTGNRPAPSQVNSGPGEGFGLVVDTHKKIGLRKLVS